MSVTTLTMATVLASSLWRATISRTPVRKERKPAFWETTQVKPFFGAVILKTYHEYEEEVVEYHLQVKSPAYERTKEARDQTKNGAVDCLPKKVFLKNDFFFTHF